MILRRVTSHLRRQEWTAVILDFLIVVAGVFIGLQVSDWNAARKDRADERLFMVQLHDDILLAEQLSARLRERRLERIKYLVHATDVIFARAPDATLTSEDCEAIGTAHYFNFVASDFPSLVELISTGRMTIVRNAALRRALVALQQKRSALAFLVDVQSPKAIDLAAEFPELIAAVAAF